MAGPSRETLRGYVLEELLAALIKTTGYRLLVDEGQDPAELENRHNGLAVRGRGGVHQVDVLGELAWIPAFTFPLRLIVEAKARTDSKVGIGEVRNAVGVVSDVNQNFTSGAATRVLLQRFAYRFALFSTTGFSAPAAQYALAHQISLVDLSGPDFDDVRELADDVSSAFWTDDPPDGRGGFVRRLRVGMRRALDTRPSEVDPAEYEDPAELEPLWQQVRAFSLQRVEDIGELFVGMANGPYLLLLRARDPRRVVELLNAQPVRDVEIYWSSHEADGIRWTIELVPGDESLSLSFALPKPVAEWIFDPEADARRRAIQFKTQFLSSITIYRYVGGRDRLYRLRFSPRQLEAFWRERRADG